MTSLLFLIVGAGMSFAWFGHRKPSVALYTIGLVLAAVWFEHHATTALGLAF